MALFLLSSHRMQSDVKSVLVIGSIIMIVQISIYIFNVFTQRTKSGAEHSQAITAQLCTSAIQHQTCTHERIETSVKHERVEYPCIYTLIRTGMPHTIPEPGHSECSYMYTSFSSR